MATVPAKRGRGRPTNASRALAARAPGAVLEVKALYDAAGNGRRLASWRPPSTGPNKALVGNQRIRDRSRDAVRNDWSGESSVQHWTTNLIGVGIQAREKPTARNKAPRAALWARWCKVCDADGVLDFYGQQTLGTRSWLDAGEYFIRRRPRRADSPFEVPLQVQLLESDYLPLWDADNAKFLPVGNRIRSGIEFDRSGQRVAYWFHKEHPGDAGVFFTPDPTTLLRVSAADVAHVFEPKRIGQIRGVSNLAPILTRLRNVLDYDDAVLERQKLANLFMAFLKRTLPVGDDPRLDPATGLPFLADPNGAPMVSMEPGMMQELGPGESMEFANPPEAGTTYSDYMRTQHMGTSAGQGLPYELFSGDIKEVSDRTLRIVINEFRRFAEQRQWQVVIPMHCQTIRNWWVDQAVLADQITLADADAARDVTWVPHGWQYIHPVQDAQGKKLEVDAGARSRSSWITERGDDPEQVDAERAADRKREDALKLTVVAPPPATAADKQAQQQQAQAHDAQLDLIRAQASAARREPPAPAAPVFHMHAPPVTVHGPTVQNVVEPTPVQNNVTVEPSAVENHVHVAPTPVEVTNNVSPTPLEITNVIEPTPIEVVNNIEAKAGEVEVKVELPDRKTESVVQRNARGDIEHVTQTETTVKH